MKAAMWRVRIMGTLGIGLNGAAALYGPGQFIPNWLSGACAVAIAVSWATAEWFCRGYE